MRGLRQKRSRRSRRGVFSSGESDDSHNLMNERVMLLGKETELEEQGPYTYTPKETLLPKVHLSTVTLDIAKTNTN